MPKRYWAGNLTIATTLFGRYNAKKEADFANLEIGSPMLHETLPCCKYNWLAGDPCSIAAGCLPSFILIKQTATPLYPKAMLFKG
ncbi:MAG: hypothetical protein RBS43_03105 [Candidatus Cloacimonas sp.]|jgi:hypothetical protein|nr:hypothetical protein [Candidatus Cloacimonas sp.]